jgi:hypothetical protein
MSPSPLSHDGLPVEHSTGRCLPAESSTQDRGWLLVSATLADSRSGITFGCNPFSVSSMSTRGASGLMLEPHWRIMDALEAMDGVVLFNLSTAVMFAALQLLWLMMTRQLQR